MAYAYQTFSSGQIFTAAQAQQIEDNIRDHQHGLNGVVAAGAAWTTVSKGAAFSIGSTDAGTLFKCWGDFNVDFAAAATLGANFGAAFVNAGSGRIQLTASSTQWIASNSVYALTPGEGVIVTSDGIELDVVGGTNRARLVHYRQTETSLAVIPVTRLYWGDFAFYTLQVQPYFTGTATNVGFRISTDSGSSYLTSGYGTSYNANGDAAWWFGSNAASSLTVILMQSGFKNNQRSGQGFHSLMTSFLQTGVSEGYSNRTATVTPVNALQIYMNGGALTNGTIIEIWGEGRLRR